MDVADLLLRLNDKDVGARFILGIVANASAPFTVSVSGTAIELKRLSSYTTPVIGDFVLILAQGPDRICLGKIV